MSKVPPPAYTPPSAPGNYPRQGQSYGGPPPQQTSYAPPAQYDAGARFGPNSTGIPPPPPPGVKPNQAQISVAQGMNPGPIPQVKQKVFGSSSDGGTTTHFD